MRRQRRVAEPDKMIEGWDPPCPNDYVQFRISVAISQIGNASVNSYLLGNGRTELESHANMCVLGKH